MRWRSASVLDGESARARGAGADSASCGQIKKLQTLYQQLKQENEAIKGAPGSPAHVTELKAKNDMINRMRQEAKHVIDTLKAKHAEDQQKLEQKLKTELDKQAAAGSAKSDPASSQGPTAHVAALTAELAACKDKISELEVNAEWLEADKQEAASRAQEAASRADALQAQLAHKEQALAVLQERVLALQAEHEARQNGLTADRELEAAVARFEREKGEQDEAARQRAAHLQDVTGKLQAAEAREAEWERRAQELEQLRQELLRKHDQESRAREEAQKELGQARAQIQHVMQAHAAAVLEQQQLLQQQAAEERDAMLASIATLQQQLRDVEEDNEKMARTATAAAGAEISAGAGALNHAGEERQRLLDVENEYRRRQEALAAAQGQCSQVEVRRESIYIGGCSKREYIYIYIYEYI